jgi:capsular polysaccharide transport system ATP-binding protein
VITLHSIRKVLGRGHLRKLVLDDVNWSIPAGGKFVVLGQRGAGKTTLISIMSGARFPTSGWVERRGAICPARGLLRIGTAKLTPRQIAIRLGQLYHVAANDIVDFAADFANIGKVMDFPLGALPKAVQQRFNYALVYAIPFDFYLFDDWIGGRKDDFAARCRQAFDERCKDAGMILTTSAPRVAMRFDAAGGVLHQGKLTLFARVEDAIDKFNSLPPPQSTQGLELRVEEEEEEEEFE